MTVVLLQTILSLNRGVRGHEIIYLKIAQHFFRQKFKNFLFNIQLLGISIILYICKLLHSHALYVCFTVSLTDLHIEQNVQLMLTAGNRQESYILDSTVYSSISSKYILWTINSKGCSLSQEFCGQTSMRSLNVILPQLVTTHICVFEKPGVKEIYTTLFNSAFLRLI